MEKHVPVCVVFLSNLVMFMKIFSDVIAVVIRI